MEFVKIDPPGTFCNNQALRDILNGLPVRPQSFVDVGCGGGAVSKVLLDMNMKGTAIDYSTEALKIAREELKDYAALGRIAIVEGDATKDVAVSKDHDCGISYMVMEHVEDDVGFARQCAQLVRDGGHFVFAVPGRRDKWTVEDETVGHLRRYDRDDLKAVLEKAGLQDVKVISVAVPVANLLLGVSDYMIKRSGELSKKDTMSLEEQTKLSGIREIPWKTVFPAWVKIILNPITLYPLFVIQRLFYRTGLGVTMIGYGRVAR
jgi:SAM-dependent methyltransferase